jgi:hypothetical protein
MLQTVSQQSESLRELFWFGHSKLLLLEAVAEAGDSLGTQTKGNICCYQAITVKTHTSEVHISVCVMVNCKV